MKKLTLMMCGGGVKAVSYLGFIKALEEEGIEIEVLAGSSGGALAATAFSAGKSFEECVDYLKKLSIWKLINKNPFEFRKAIIDDETVSKALGEFYGDLRFSDLNRKVVVFATNLQKETYEAFTEGGLHMPLRASIAITPFISSVRIGEYDYVDGSFLTVSPTKYLKKNYDNPVLCLLPGPDVFKAPSIITKNMPYLKVILDNYYKVLLKSDEPDLTVFTLEDNNKGHFMSFENIDNYFEQGYEASKRNIDKIKKILQ